MKKILVILLLFICLRAECIEENKTYYLKDCINYALKYSPHIKSAKNNLEITKKDLLKTKAAYFPTIGAGVHYNFYLNSNKRDDDGYSKQLLPDVGVYLEQLIFDFGKTSSAVDMQKFNTIIAQYEYDNMINETVTAVKTAYFNVLEANAAVEIEENNLNINERLVDLTKRLYEENKKSKNDYIDAKINLSEAKIALEDAKNKLDNALFELQNTMYIEDRNDFKIKEINEFYYIDAYFTPDFLKEKNGKPVYKKPDNIKSGVEVTYEANLKKLPITLDEAYISANKNNPKLKALENTLNSMKKYKTASKRKYLPTLKTKVGYNRDNKYVSQIKDIKNNQLNVVVALDTSFNILANQADIKKADYLIDIAEDNIEAFKKDIYYNIKRYYTDILTAQKQIINAKEKIENSMESLEATRNSYIKNNSEVGYIELQNARKNYYSAKLEYIGKLKFYNESLANLEKSIKMYSADDFNLN